MIGENHTVVTEHPQPTVDFDRDAWCRSAAAAIAQRVDEEVLKCLSMLTGTTSSTPQALPLTASKLCVTRELIENSPALSIPSRPTFEHSVSGIRLESLYGQIVRKSVQAIAGF